MSAPEISRRLGVAPPTVTYHLGRLRQEQEVDDGRDGAPEGAVEHSSTRDAVAALLAGGMAKAQIAEALGLSPATISYHVRRLGGAVDQRCARRYDWARIQSYYDDGHSVRDCMEAFGFSSASWFEAVKRGAVVARPARLPVASCRAPTAGDTTSRRG